MPAESFVGRLIVDGDGHVKYFDRAASGGPSSMSMDRMARDAHVVFDVTADGRLCRFQPRGWAADAPRFWAAVPAGCDHAAGAVESGRGERSQSVADGNSDPE